MTLQCRNSSQSLSSQSIANVDYQESKASKDEVFVTVSIDLNTAAQAKTSLKAKLDTGAQGNILPIRLYQCNVPTKHWREWQPQEGSNKFIRHHPYCIRRVKNKPPWYRSHWLRVQGEKFCCVVLCYKYTRPCYYWLINIDCPIEKGHKWPFLYSTWLSIHHAVDTISHEPQNKSDPNRFRTWLQPRKYFCLIVCFVHAFLVFLVRLYATR